MVWPAIVVAAAVAVVAAGVVADEAAAAPDQVAAHFADYRAADDFRQWQL